MLKRIKSHCVSEGKPKKLSHTKNKIVVGNSRGGHEFGLCGKRVRRVSGRSIYAKANLKGEKKWKRGGGRLETLKGVYPKGEGTGNIRGECPCILIKKKQRSPH